MNKYIIIICLIMVTACQKKLTPQQVSGMNNNTLCFVFQNIRPYSRKTERYITSEVARRNLDCNPNHLACIEYGHVRGTQSYANCRIELHRQNNILVQQQMRNESEQQQMNTLVDGLKEIKQTPEGGIRPYVINTNPYYQAPPVYRLPNGIQGIQINR